jgi:hypothetical protein
MAVPIHIYPTNNVDVFSIVLSAIETAPNKEKAATDRSPHSP